MLKLLFGPERRAGADHRRHVLGYLHSTGADGSDVDQLLPRITTFCAAEGLAVDEVYVDVGETDARPAFAALVEALRVRPCRGIVVTGTDQLAGDPAGAWLRVRRIRSAGADLITVEGGRPGKTG